MTGTNGNEPGPTVPRPPSVPIPPRPTKALLVHPAPVPNPNGPRPRPDGPTPIPQPPYSVLRFAGGLLGGVGALWLLWIVARIWGAVL